MMLMRVNMRLVLVVLCGAVLLATLYWGHCGDISLRPTVSLLSESQTALSEIECSINGEYSVSCRRDRDQVYLPFSFIHKYFEIYGKITATDGVEKFEWSHSYSKVYHPKKKYDPRGTFTTFENYNVEVRDRVKCISGIEGVPVSTQWEPRGFFYPTQIAQFGLAHYSKNLTEPEPRIRVIDDGDKVLENWIVSQDALMSRELDPELKANVIRFTTTDQPASQVRARLNISQDFVLSMDLMLKPNSSVTVILQNKDKKETVYLHYVTSTQLIYAQEDHIYYGVGLEQKWRRLTRDLIIDMQKGWALQDRPKRKSPRNKFKVSGLALSGAGSVGNVRVSSSEHMFHFFSAARWLVSSQRADGGWPVPARRRLAPRVPDLMPGWHSAMSQGHAISLLSRAYHRSGDSRYLRAARRALGPLDRPPDKGGVRALFMNRYVWYEEYPTKPPIFVLNGFIYTLLGLYDLHYTEGGRAASPAKDMFEAGMLSLKTLLPLFDTGSGSFYDLRHFTLGASPNIARWDYHATHVNQLYLLAGLDPDPVLLATARRWEGYMQGRRAAHN
ncbi:D-glucuronyl C5-epimerase B isoform X1 [Danaus plexippus]|uniref:heparosan-N-sulfate-glucuronate 5-epimerase n=1 Tax=Danaus plexippus plexippus TaxID=278856 RepID=A0A212FNT6_DANPL|nr:D-glucuronyl C5-epimerase B isoform X1 [Danaus plexippus]XP_032513946.1 D-glucuronyl C5-epimerase B isoform X1 [Danaus plexippus]XP_061383394.1 D-glucuronyl C5-epimerase B isoform X1 [Danaus plexippus]OWR55408.1 D-glucuronyl C5-epimerase [Danaus plexippus plexippus]